MIIFTDLDGTLLDHETYGFEAAGEALDRIKAKGIPLIFATSKTAAEIAPLRAQTGIVFPAIVENGAGIDWPDAGGEGDAPSTYDEIRAVLSQLPDSLKTVFRGFGDMSDRELAERAGLSRAAAALARRRSHSEPGLFLGHRMEKRALVEWLNEKGLTAQQGGRFLTISKGATKADCMAEIAAWWARSGGGEGPTLALGDAENDVAMLEAADFGVIVKNRAHAALPPLAGEAQGRISRTSEEGPAGWNAAVLSYLSDDAPLKEGARR